MDNLIVNGDMAVDHLGQIEMVSGMKEIIQRAMIRLTVRQGNFSYDQQLGSGLYHLNLHKIDDFTLLSIVRDALAPIEEISVTGVEKSVDYENHILWLTIYLRVREQNAILEINQKLW